LGGSTELVNASDVCFVPSNYKKKSVERGERRDGGRGRGGGDVTGILLKRNKRALSLLSSVRFGTWSDVLTQTFNGDGKRKKGC